MDSSEEPTTQAREPITGSRVESRIPEQEDPSDPPSRIAEFINSSTENSYALYQILRDWVAEKSDELSARRIEHENQILLTINRNSQRISILRNLETGEREEVTSAVQSAYWSVLSPFRFRETLQEIYQTYPILSSGTAIVLLFTSFRTLPHAYHYLSHSLSGTSFDNVWFSPMAAFLIWRQVSRVSKRLDILGHESMATLFESVVTFLGITLLTWTQWEILVQGAADHLGTMHLPTGLSFPTVKLACTTSILLITVLGCLGLIERLVQAFGVRREIIEPPSAVASGLIVLQLADAACAAQLALNYHNIGPGGHWDNEPSTRESRENRKGYRSYMGSDERRKIIHACEKIAAISENQWRRSIRTGDRSADRSTRELANGIGAAARRWKVTASGAGESQLEYMCENFTRALVDASMGEWNKLAVEATSGELLSQRIGRLVRHFAALAIALSTVTFIAIRPFGWPSHPFSSLAQSVIFVTSGIICLSIDPTLNERVASAIKLMSPFSAK